MNNVIHSFHPDDKSEPKYLQMEKEVFKFVSLSICLLLSQLEILDSVRSGVSILVPMGKDPRKYDIFAKK